MPRLRIPTPAPIQVPQVQPVPLADKLGLSVAEAAELSGLGETMIRAEISAGRLKVARIGRAIVISKIELEAWLARETQRSAVAPGVPEDLRLLQALVVGRHGLQVAREAGEELNRVIAAIQEKAASG
jgi:excisionase family DNA binding protein